MRSGEPEFERAVEATIAILREVARDSRDEADARITYRHLSERLAEHGLQVPYHGGPMPHILEEASRREHAAGRGMVSALVVQQGTNGKPDLPSRGFYPMARRAPFNRVGDDYEIWLTEVRRLRAENAPGRSGRTVVKDRRVATDRLVTAENLGAWMIKCNPEVWDLTAFLAHGEDTITNWSVIPTYRTELMNKGQRVLFWVTGRDGANLEPGLWGDGVVLGRVSREGVDNGPGYWLDEGYRQQAEHKVPVDVQLFHEPVPRQLLSGDQRLTSMEIFRQPQMGNPLFVTRDELAAIEEYLPAQPTKLTITASGAGFGNPATNAAVEAAAMKAATAKYEGGGWQVKDVSKENLGWNLTCTSPNGEVHKVEVKGVSGLRPVIMLTRNEERAARVEADWRLAVATKALADAELLVVDSQTALAACRPFMYEVDLRPQT